MNGMTIGQIAALVALGVVATVLLIVGIVLLIDWLERAKLWLQKRKMKTYMVQYNTCKTFKSAMTTFYDSSIETKYFKARCPSAAVKKLLEGQYEYAGIGGICIYKVVEIKPV